MTLLALPSLSFSGLRPSNPKPAKTLFHTITHKHQKSVVYARNTRILNNSVKHGVKRKVGIDTTKMPIENGVPECEKDPNFRKILLSDVVVMKRRNVFWGRKWCFWDVFSLGCEIGVHVPWYLASKFSLPYLGEAAMEYGWVAVLTFGEGWHNNHHAFEHSARQGLEWWQIDMTWYVISFLEAIGLATDVKLPTSAQKQRMASTTNQ